MILAFLSPYVHSLISRNGIALNGSYEPNKKMFQKSENVSSSICTVLAWPEMEFCS